MRAYAWWPLLLTACDPGSVYISEITGENGNELDAVRNGCWDAAHTTCDLETFTNDYALISVHNDGAGNASATTGTGGDEEATVASSAGRILLESFKLTYTPREADAPALSPQSGTLSIVVPVSAEEDTTFRVVLASLTTKDEFASANQPIPKRYSATYELEGSNGLSLEGSMDVIIGAFDLCPESLEAAEVCP